MPKKSPAPEAAAAENDDNKGGGKENSNSSTILTPEVLDAMSGKSLVGMDGRKRRIHVDTEESGYTTEKPHPEDVLLGRGRPVSNEFGATAASLGCM